MDNKEFENIKKKLQLTNQEVSDILGVRLKTVKNWADGIWEMPLMAEKFLRMVMNNRKPDINCSIATTSEYRRGYKEGYSISYSMGYSMGYNIGYRTGCSDSYDDGCGKNN